MEKLLLLLSTVVLFMECAASGRFQCRKIPQGNSVSTDTSSTASGDRYTTPTATFSTVTTQDITTAFTGTTTKKIPTTSNKVLSNTTTTPNNDETTTELKLNLIATVHPFYYFGDIMTYSDAADACVKKGGVLATVKSDEDQENMNALAYHMGAANPYIGLKQTGSLEYTWEDGDVVIIDNAGVSQNGAYVLFHTYIWTTVLTTWMTPTYSGEKSFTASTYTNAKTPVSSAFDGTGRDNQDCIYFRNINRRWQDGLCTDERPFVCRLEGGI